MARRELRGRTAQPFGLAVEFTDLTGSATISGQKIVVSGFDGKLYDGTLKGNATIKWGNALAADGEFTLNGADVAKLLPAFTREFAASGVLNINAKFATQGKTLEELFAAPRVAAAFSVSKGMLNNVDLVRAIQSAGRTPQRAAERHSRDYGRSTSIRQPRFLSQPQDCLGP
jgi:uncharacterized protein involved in outer membrane biogenesis